MKYKGPIRNIPDELVKKYTMNRKIKIYDYYCEEEIKKKNIWDQELIKEKLT